LKTIKIPTTKELTQAPRGTWASARGLDPVCFLNALIVLCI
jgi:hypothetical protein